MNNYYPNNMQNAVNMPQNYGIPNAVQTQQAPVQQMPAATMPAQLIPMTQVVAAWVQDGDIAGKMYVEPNKIAFMIDAANNKIYVKTTDNIGKQSPMQAYNLEAPPEPESASVDLSGYVTKQDFSDLAARFGDLEDKIARLFESIAPKKKTKREDIDDAE